MIPTTQQPITSEKAREREREGEREGERGGGRERQRERKGYGVSLAETKLVTGVKEAVGVAGGLKKTDAGVKEKEVEKEVETGRSGGHGAT